MLKIHYHSDCHFFAGCENMLVNFLSSTDLKEKYQISFSFRYTDLYSKQFKSRVKTDVQVYPLYFPGSLPLLVFGNRLVRFLSKSISFLLGIFLSLPISFIQFVFLFGLLRKLKPDLLHLNNGNYPGALSPRIAVFVAWILRIPNIIFVVNNIAIDYSRPSRWLHFPFDVLISKWVTKFVTGSQFASVKLAEVLKLQPNQLLSIHNGIKLRFPDETEQATKERLGVINFNGIIFAVVSILRENKGHLVLLKAIKLIIEKHPEYVSKMRFLIEGQGVIKEELETFIKKNSLEDSCILLGSEANVMNLLNMMDVLILPSTSLEDFPNVILEAMSFGKPVIASRLAGTPEQIDNEVNGLLVEPGNFEALSRAIMYMVDNPNQMSDMGEKGRERFKENFESDYSVKNYIKLYDSILKENKK